MNDDDDDQSPQEERQRRRSRSRERVHPHAQVPQEPQTQPMVSPEADEVSDEEFSDVNESLNHQQLDHHHQLNKEVVPKETKDLDRCERAPPRSSSQNADEDSAPVDPQNRVHDRSRSPQEQEESRRQDPQQQKGKKTVADKRPSEPPKAKKHTSIDSDEDEEEPRNEPGTSSNCTSTSL